MMLGGLSLVYYDADRQLCLVVDPIWVGGFVTHAGPAIVLLYRNSEERKCQEHNLWFAKLSPESLPRHQHRVPAHPVKQQQRLWIRAFVAARRAPALPLAA
jgi:hypothetical protein